eukprot:COSAG05_NODE_5156_length_1250_cov_4.640313_1_plen_92_part_00
MWLVLCCHPERGTLRGVDMGWIDNSPYEDNNDGSSSSSSSSDGDDGGGGGGRQTYGAYAGGVGLDESSIDVTSMDLWRYPGEGFGRCNVCT